MPQRLTLRSKLPSVICGVIGAAALAAAAITARPGYIAASVLALLAGLTRFGHAGRARSACRPLLGKAVRVAVWGERLPESLGQPLILASVRAIGAGLHFAFRAEAGSSTVHIKVAQPSRTHESGSSVAIGSAKYVQVNGKTISSVPSADAFAVRCD